MKEAQPRAIRLEDYKPSAFLISRTDLVFDLHDEYAEVTNEMVVTANPKAASEDDLVLDGQGLELIALSLDGRQLEPSQYQLSSDSLVVHKVPREFTLRTVCRIEPQKNKSLEGLYRSGSMFCTQCEAEGFRKITWYLDRPDVMARFSTKVIADEDRYPVLLSNGNPLAREQLADGRHSVSWVDPFPKPAYLFALVAGKLSVVEDSFTTISGRDIALLIYVEEKDLDKCQHAMESLKASMAWDEQKYGREYDLDLYMIVAVDDFNMGAMENKGLNIFNTSCVLAKPTITTDAAFQRVEGVIAHEYFHNWSGNRVTCRDWFQLSLKEGFTVFRDSQFSADMNSRAVKRIEDVTLLRTMQFAEDAGPTAHPVRPDAYIEINNFYTLTIYEKGAEVVGMLHTLLGAEAFRRGSDIYFERHDGSAATCDDFVAAMEEAGGRELTQFKRWYSQAGTPRLSVTDDYDAASGCYTLHFSQSCPATPGQADKEAFVIPVRVGLVGQGGALSFARQADGETLTETVLAVDESSQSFTLYGLTEKPVPSLLRGFSAPVKLAYDYSREERLFLMRHDPDGFNRWEACQQLASETLQRMVVDIVDGQQPHFDLDLVEAYRQLLLDEKMDRAVLANMLDLPSEAYLAEQADQVHPLAIHEARQHASAIIGSHLSAELLASYEGNQVSEAYQPEINQIARRALANQALAYLASTGDEAALALAYKQYQGATNMTDSLAALRALVHSGEDAVIERALSALRSFFKRWSSEPLAVNLFLQVQATSPRYQVAAIRELVTHPAFDLYNPNKVRAVIGAFAAGNSCGFHAQDGSGHRFLAEQVAELDGVNPQVAARLLTPLTRWRKYAPESGQSMRAALETLAARPGLSPDVYEIVSKSLA